jgi:hypothetical protein
MYSESMPSPDPRKIQAIRDPTERALAVGLAFEELTKLDQTLRQIRQAAVLELRAQGQSWGEIAAALHMARSRPKQIAEGRTDTRAR